MMGSKFWNFSKVWWTFFNRQSAFQWKQTVFRYSLTHPLVLSFEIDFITDFIQKKKHRFARSFDLSFIYICDVLLLNNFISHLFIPDVTFYERVSRKADDACPTRAPGSKTLLCL